MGRTVTRYAPSPTGNPHVGNIRTAIFNYLYARAKGGSFLLRIEDTDRARFVPEAIEYIEESLKWLGLEYDGEKTFQSERLPVYKKFAEELIEKGLAYKCYCTPERLEKLRNEQEEKGLPPAYDKHCRELPTTEAPDGPYVIRFAMPEKGTAVWEDLVRGKLSIDYKTQDDFVMIKSDGWPTYNFANVIDDHEMDVTDVIRGEEFIPSTPKHIALYEALGWDIPNFAHLPLILGGDKAKLSKRHGDTAILDYKEKGYLPEAMLNFLALLGWNPGSTEEIFTRDELIKSFDISRVQKSPAVFDIEKLNWLNGQYIRKLEIDSLKGLMEGLEPLRGKEIIKSEKILKIEQPRLNTLLDILNDTDYYKILPEYKSELLIFKKSDKEKTIKGLEGTLRRLQGNLETETDAAEILNGAKNDEKLDFGDVFWPVRVALSGKEKSPSPSELLWVLGKEESEKRIQKALDKLK